MWHIYVIDAVYATALLAAIATIPLARRGARRLLWSGWVTLAIVLPIVATYNTMRLIPPSWPLWRFALADVLMLAVPTGIAALVADKLAQRQPMPARGRHAALVACAVVVAVAASFVISYPLTSKFELIDAEQ
jgi:MFS family permease